MIIDEFNIIDNTARRNVGIDAKASITRTRGQEDLKGGSKVASSFLSKVTANGWSEVAMDGGAKVVFKGVMDVMLNVGLNDVLNVGVIKW